jgi:capsular exopolysaccharide synthesis family protein
MLTVRKPPEYTTASLIQFLETEIDQETLGEVPGGNDADTIAATNVVLVGRNAVAQEAARRLDGRMTGGEIRDRLDIAAQPDTSIVRVAATDRDPRRAAELANVYAASFIALDNAETRRRLLQARAVVRRELNALSENEREGPRAYQLGLRATQLDLLIGGRQQRARSVQKAEVPSTPSTPPPLRNTLFGGLLGLILGVALAAVRDQTDRRLRNETDLAEAYDAPLLASVPTSRQLRKAHGSLDELPARDAEVFRLLQAHLRYAIEGDRLSSIAVTSASSSEGKTTVAWHFASAYARTTGRVLLVEADMRRPALAVRFRLDPTRGLIDVLEGRMRPDEAIQGADPVDGHDLDVLVAGAGTSANVADLAQSAAAVALLRWAESEYDLVVVDVPPLPMVSDAVAFVRLVDGVIVVGHRDHALASRVRRLSDQLRSLDVRVVGVVANGFDDSALSKSYEYY